MSTFSHWLAALLKQSDVEVQRLLRNESALHFLVTWSLFESKCFNGFLKAKSLREFADRLVNDNFSLPAIADQLSHFHERYQDKRSSARLLQGARTPGEVANEFNRLLAAPVERLTPAESVFFVICVVYRYRNNMFHGYKGVESWLQYEPQIRRCTSAMQAFVLHSEARSPTMAFGQAA